jgi:hypothetical protein
MSVTVGKTLAFAAGRVLDGQVRVRGVTGPYDKDVWGGVLSDLEDVGVRVNETWSWDQYPVLVPFGKQNSIDAFIKQKHGAFPK